LFDKLKRKIQSNKLKQNAAQQAIHTAAQVEAKHAVKRLQAKDIVQQPTRSGKYSSTGCMHDILTCGNDKCNAEQGNIKMQKSNASTHPRHRCKGKLYSNC